MATQEYQVETTTFGNKEEYDKYLKKLSSKIVINNPNYKKQKIAI